MLKPQKLCRMRQSRSTARSTPCDAGAGTPSVSSVISQVQFVTQDRGGAAEHKGPGDLTLSIACQELVLCCRYSPIADETLHRILPGLPAGEALLTGRAGVGGHGASRLPLPEWHQYGCMKFRTKEPKHVKRSPLYFTLLCLSLHILVLPLLPTYILAGEMYAYQLQLVAKHFKCYHNWMHFALNMLNALSIFYSLNIF